MLLFATLTNANAYFIQFKQHGQKGTVTFGAEELQNIKSFYEQERIQLVAKLQHVDEVIAQLGGNVPAAAKPVPVPDAQPAVKRGPGRPRKTAPDAKAKKAGRPKKRGPKSVWGNFILRRLRQCDRPLSYAELVRDAMVLNNIPVDREKNAKASVLNAAFRLRNTLKKVDTVGRPGKKEKFLVLTSWVESEGKLKAPYDKLFESVSATPMDDRGRKPRRSATAEKPAAKKAAPVREAAAEAGRQEAARAGRREAGRQGRRPAAAAKPAARRPPAKPPRSRPPRRPLPRVKLPRSRPPRRPLPRRKAAAKPAAKKAAPARKAAAKPAAKKAAPARKGAAKPAAQSRSRA